jgi:hypothetical protein
MASASESTRRVLTVRRQFIQQPQGADRYDINSSHP